MTKEKTEDEFEECERCEIKWVLHAAFPQKYPCAPGPCRHKRKKKK